MAKINQDYLYTDSNLWVEVKNNIARVGINDYSQDEFGEIVYVDLPKIGKEYAKDDEICIIESVKTASDIYTPLSGKVTKVNQELLNDPKLINESCYDKGWIFEIEIANLDELNSLINPQDYQSYVS